MSQSIDLESLEMVGEPKLLEERPSFVSEVSSVPLVEVADGGEMLYAPVDARGPPPSSGSIATAGGARAAWGGGTFEFPAVSHRGDRAVVTRAENVTERSLWIFDLEQGGGLRITPRDRSSYSAVWSPDDRELAADVTYRGFSRSLRPSFPWRVGGSGSSSSQPSAGRARPT